MKLIPDFDTITIEYTFDKNYEKLKPVLLKNVFTSKPNWKYKLQGIGFISLPKIRYDIFNIKRPQPYPTMYLLNNSLHTDDNKLLVRIKVRTSHLIGLVFSALLLLIFFVIIMTITIESIISSNYIIVVFILLVILPMLVGFATIDMYENYADSRDHLIWNFEELLQDNDIVFRRTNELKPPPTWLQKLKNIFS